MDLKAAPPLGFFKHTHLSFGPLHSRGSSFSAAPGSRLTVLMLDLVGAHQTDGASYGCLCCSVCLLGTSRGSWSSVCSSSAVLMLTVFHPTASVCGAAAGWQGSVLHQRSRCVVPHHEDIPFTKLNHHYLVIKRVGFLLTFLSGCVQSDAFLLLFCSTSEHFVHFPPVSLPALISAQRGCHINAALVL